MVFVCFCISLENLKEGCNFFTRSNDVLFFNNDKILANFFRAICRLDVDDERRIVEPFSNLFFFVVVVYREIKMTGVHVKYLNTPNTVAVIVVCK